MHKVGEIKLLIFYVGLPVILSVSSVWLTTSAVMCVTNGSLQFYTNASHNFPQINQLRTPATLFTSSISPWD